MQPFVTQNRKLAEALALAGCSWASEEDGGPTRNIYTAGFLRDRKLLPNEQVTLAKFEQAAKSAESRRVPGIVSYYFVRDKTFRDAEGAWQAVALEIQRAELASEPPKLPDISAEVVAQVLCIAANSAKHLADAPFLNPAWVTTLSGTKTKSDTSESGFSISGTGKAWPLNATKEVREKLGI